MFIYSRGEKLLTKRNHALSGILLAEGSLALISPSLLTLPGLNYVFQNDVSTVFYVVAGSIIGAVFPDIDLRIPFLEHRTLTHWFIPYLAGLIAAYFYDYYLALFFCIGALVHILLDSLSLMGVPIWTPFGRRKGFRLMRVSGPLEIVATILILGCIYGIWLFATKN